MSESFGTDAVIFMVGFLCGVVFSTIMLLGGDAE